MNEPRAARHFDLLLIIRGLAAVSVVIWHTEGYKALYPAALNTSGRVAVWIFFGISGYVIAYGFVNGRYRLVPSGLAYFYRNRFLRIYPLFIALSVLAWATEWWVSGHNPIPAAEMPAQLLAAQWNQTYTLLGVFWTLGIELHYYLLAPLLALPLLMRGRLQPVIALVVYAAMVYWCEYATTHLGWSWDGRNIVSNLPHFFAGMIACRAVTGIQRPRPALALIALAGAMALLGYTNWLYHTHGGQFWSVRGVLLADAMIVLLVVAHANIAAPASAGGRLVAAFSFLGVLSYGVYAWHNYIMKYVTWTSGQMFVLIALSIGAAYASYVLIERPALARKKHAPGVAAPVVPMKQVTV